MTTPAQQGNEDLSSSVSHRPNGGSGSWVFDEAVTSVFDDMLERSVPIYRMSQQLTLAVATEVLRPGDAVLDVGVSTAATFRALEPVLKGYGCHPIGVDPSEEMIGKARENYPDATYHAGDVQGFLKSHPSLRVRLTLMSLTLQFIPIEHRNHLLSALYERTLPGGAILLFEKCLGSDNFEEDFFTHIYYNFKEANGYSRDSIYDKRKSLENVLVPVTREFNQGLLRQAGFQTVPLAQWCQFTLYAGFKR